MTLTSDRLIERVATYVGRSLTTVEKEEFRRMSELIKREDDDVAWSLILAMWGARMEATTALTDAKDGLRSGLDIWIERIVVDLAGIDERRRSIATEIKVESDRTVAAISQATARGTAALEKRMAEMEGQIEAMASKVEQATVGATGALKAAERRDSEIQKQVKETIAGYATTLSDIVLLKIETALKTAEQRLEAAATQAQLASKPLFALWGMLLIGVVIGTVSGFVLFELLAHAY